MNDQASPKDPPLFPEDTLAARALDQLDTASGHFTRDGEIMFQYGELRAHGRDLRTEDDLMKFTADLQALLNERVSHQQIAVTAKLSWVEIRVGFGDHEKPVGTATKEEAPRRNRFQTRFQPQLN